MNAPAPANTAPTPVTRRSRRHAMRPATGAVEPPEELPQSEGRGAPAPQDEACAVEGVSGDAEPIVIPDSEPETDDDAFLEAARALNFTGANDLVTEGANAATEQRSVVPAASGGADAVRRGARRGRRVMTTAAASASAMAAIGLLLVGFTTPLGAIGAPSADGNLTSSALSVSASGSDERDADEEIQAFVAGSDITAGDLDRVQHYNTTTFAELAEVEGINTANAFFTNDPTADIQWPYVVGTGMSHGYGMRWGRLHQGIDFTPGDGAPIQAIADGTVRVASESGGGYGVHVYIDHVIDGQAITSHYAHMQYGSLRVEPGQRVEVGDVIGLTGNTGYSFGSHLHFELLIGGQTFDPLPWLREWAGTHFPKEDADSGDDGEFASEDAG